MVNEVMEKMIEKLINLSREVRNIKVNKKEILEVKYGILTVFK